MVCSGLFGGQFCGQLDCRSFRSRGVILCNVLGWVSGVPQDGKEQGFWGSGFVCFDGEIS